jgi:molybdenum cofactor cytidylyltransferase
MISAIVLAAGQSRRMGGQKVLLPYGEVTVIEHIVHTLEEAGADEIIAVVGHDADRVAAALQNTAARIVLNPDYQSGMLSSARCGIRAVFTRARAFLIALGDQPSIRCEVVRALIQEFKNLPEDSQAILVPTCDGRRGHPMIVFRHFRDPILTRFDDVGLRGLLQAHPDLVREIPVAHPGILRDMDAPQDYANELDALDKETRRNDGTLDT